MILADAISRVITRLLPACKRNTCFTRFDFGLSHVCSFIEFDCGARSNFHAYGGGCGGGIAKNYSVTSAHTSVARAPYNQFVNHFIVDP